MSRRILLLGILCWPLLGLASWPSESIAAQPRAPKVVGINLDGVVNPVIADAISQEIKAAQGAEAIVIKMDTPGGLDASMRKIVKSILGSKTIVVVWIAPRGARALSEGAVIALAAHVIVGSEDATIGAANPIAGGSSTDVDRKIFSDATAYVQTLASMRGRAPEPIRRMVTTDTSYQLSQAMSLGIIDFSASTETELLQRLDGALVREGQTRRVVGISATEIEYTDLSLARKIQQRIADPNLAFLLLSLGALAILYEISNPGLGAGGIIGAVLLVLAFFSLSVLEVRVGGISLIALAFALFVAELFVPGVGVLGAGGAVSLGVGGLFLFPDGFGVDLGFLIPTAVSMGVGVVLIARAAYKTRHLPTVTPGGDPVGFETTVSDRGQIFFSGAWWQIEGADKGDRVRVVAVEGLTFIVEPLDDPNT